MNTLASTVKTSSETFKKNTDAMKGLVKDFRAKLTTITSGGTVKGRDRHVKHGKLLPRDRITKLLDPGSPFLELSQFAGYELYDEPVPCGGIITGIGQDR